MTTVDFITDLFCRVDDEMKETKKHSQSSLYPSEIVVLGLLHALKGVGNRAFYRWLIRDYHSLFPKLPERTRLFRLFKTHQGWAKKFLAKPTLLGVVDSYGIELIHPIREGRSPNQIGKKGISNHRWIVGAKLCLVLNQLGEIIAWSWASANTHDSHFHDLIEQFKSDSVIFSDTAFHSAKGDPDNLKCCKRGTWNDRMLVETVFSMLTTVSHFKKCSQRVTESIQARLAFAVALFNLLIRWSQLNPDSSGFVPLSIAQFSL
jgi:hypothetical protein